MTKLFNHNSCPNVFFSKRAEKIDRNASSILLLCFMIFGLWTGFSSFCTAQISQSAGTGFAINSQGYFCTCYHVVSETTSITVIIHTAEGRKVSYRAEIITVDAANDIAVIKINGKDIKAVPVYTDNVSVGQDALVIGYPLLVPLGQSAKMTKGLVSGFVSSIIQIDAPINPGNSGCPVVNQYGQCFGVASAKMSGLRVSNIGFCIPSNALARLLDENGIQYEKATAAANAQAKPLTPAKVFEQVNGSLALILANKRPGAAGTVVIRSDPSNPNENAGAGAEGSTSENQINNNVSNSPPRDPASSAPSDVSNSRFPAQPGSSVGPSSSTPNAANPIDFSQYPDGIILESGSVAVAPKLVGKSFLKPGQTWLAPSTFVPVPETEKASSGDVESEISYDPDSEAVQKAKEKLLKKYAGEIRLANSPMKKALLTKKLFSDAQAEKNSYDKFVQLCIVRDMAIEAGDANTTRRVVQEIVEGWDLDPFPANRSSFMAVGRKIKSASQWEHLGNWAIELSQMAIKRDEPKLAELLIKIMAVAVKKSESKSLQDDSESTVKMLTFLVEANKQAESSKDSWTEKADDPAVCVQKGLYHCFANNNFVEGLPELVKGNDSLLKSAAEKELEGLKKSSRRLEAANLWWDASETANPLYKEKIQARAVYHYSKIVGSTAAKTLDEEERRKLTKRISPNRELLQTYSDIMEQADANIAALKKQTQDAPANADSLVNDDSPEAKLFRYIRNEFKQERYKKSPMAGNVSTGDAYTSVLKEGGLMVGLEISFNSSMGVSSLTPLFQDKPGLEEIRGATIGYKSETIAKIMSKPGYAICSIRIVGSTGIEGMGGIQVLCARIGERSLTHDDVYTSSFVGRGRVEQAATFTSNGGFIVGLQGQMSDPGVRQLLALGIVTVAPIPESETAANVPSPAPGE